MTAGTGTNPLILNGAGGNVGIGTTSPNAPLNVWGSGPFSGLTANPQPGQLIINTTTGSERLILGSWYTGGTGSICSIQASDYYSSVDHGQALVLNPLGGSVGIGASPGCKLDVRGGALGVSSTSPYAAVNSYMQAGSLAIGDTLLNYGGGASQWNTNTAGLIMECLNSTEIAIHDAGDRVVSFMYYSGNRYTIGRDMGWGSIASTNFLGNVGIGTTNPTKPLVVVRPGAGGANPAIMVGNNGGGSGLRFQTYDLTAQGDAYMGLGTDMSGGPFEHSIVFPDPTTSGYVGNSRMTFGKYNGTTYTTLMTLLNGGNLGIGTATPATSLHVYNGDSSTATFGPNATWGATLRVGSGNQYNSGTSGLASVIATNGNLHIDSGTGQNLYLQYFVNGAGVGGPTNSYGSWSHTGAMTVSAVLTGNGGYSGYGTQNYFGGGGGTAGNGFDFEDQTTFMRMAQRNVRWYDWNGAGDFFYAHNGCVGIRTDQTSSVFEVAGRSYIWGNSLAGGGQNRFTGLEADSSANGRAQLVLNSSYSDMIICSSQTNGNHGSTISFTTNSTANNDYRKFVIDQNNWGPDASGTGGYGDRLCFDWRDGAYTNPHSYVDPGNATMTLYGRGHSVGINSVRTPGYNLQVSGNDYTSGGRYTSDFFRIYGGGGIYWQDYGGGWNMSDTTYMRVYGDKWIYTGGYIQSAAGFRVGDGRVIIDSSYNHYGWFRPYNDGWHYCSAGYRRFYFATAGRTYIEGNDGVEIRRSDDTYVASFNNDLSIDFRSTVRMNGQLQTQNNGILMGSGVLSFQNSSTIYDDAQLKLVTDDNIYFYATNDFHFYNGGSIRCDADIIAYASDERIKTRLGVIDNALDKVKQLTGFYYEHNELGKKFGFNDGGVKVGVSAQEVQKVMPEVVKPAPFDFALGVSTSGENYLTVQYEKLVPLLIESIKELSAKVEKLEKIISTSI